MLTRYREDSAILMHFSIENTVNFEFISRLYFVGLYGSDLSIFFKLEGNMHCEEA